MDAGKWSKQVLLYHSFLSFLKIKDLKGLGALHLFICYYFLERSFYVILSVFRTTFDQLWIPEGILGLILEALKA